MKKIVISILILMLFIGSFASALPPEIKKDKLNTNFKINKIDSNESCIVNSNTSNFNEAFNKYDINELSIGDPPIDPPLGYETRLFEKNEICGMLDWDDGGIKVSWWDQDGSLNYIDIGDHGGGFTCGDWNCDGKDEFAFYTSSVFPPLTRVHIYDCNGVEIFTGEDVLLPFCDGLEFADVDGDGFDEICGMLDWDDGGIKVSWWDQDGSLNYIDIGDHGGGFTCGDWNCDGKDEFAFYTSSVFPPLTRVHIYDCNGVEIFTGEDVLLPFCDGLEFAEIDSNDGFYVDYQYYADYETLYHPLCLVYHPPYKNGINHPGSYSEYSESNSGGESDENTVGTVSKSIMSAGQTISFYIDIFSFGSERTIESEIIKTYGEKQEIITTTGYSTGNAIEPCVVVHSTEYRQFLYEIIDSPYSEDIGVTFSVDIPIGTSKTIVPVSFYNNEVDDFMNQYPGELHPPKIILDHYSGDPTSYTDKYISGIDDNEWITVGNEGDVSTKIDILSEGWQSLTETEDDSAVAGISVLGIFEHHWFEPYDGKTGTTHTIFVGEETEFYGKLKGIPSDLWEEYQYEYQMYVRRDNTNKYLIIDYYVDPDSLGSGYDQQDNPILNIDPNSVNFGSHNSGWTGSDTIEIWNSGEGTLEYTLTEDCNWISISPSNGNSNGEHDTITVNVINTDSLDSGQYSYNIGVSSNGGNGNINVNIEIVEGDVSLTEAITCEWVNDDTGEHGPTVTDFEINDQIHVYLQWGSSSHNFNGDIIGFKWFHDGINIWEDTFTITEDWPNVYWHLYTTDDWHPGLGSGYIEAYWNGQYLGKTNNYNVNDITPDISITYPKVGHWCTDRTCIPVSIIDDIGWGVVRASQLRCETDYEGLIDKVVFYVDCPLGYSDEKTDNTPPFECTFKNDLPNALAYTVTAEAYANGNIVDTYSTGPICFWRK